MAFTSLLACPTDNVTPRYVADRYGSRTVYSQVAKCPFIFRLTRLYSQNY